MAYAVHGFPGPGQYSQGPLRLLLRQDHDETDTHIEGAVALLSFHIGKREQILKGGRHIPAADINRHRQLPGENTLQIIKEAAAGDM